VLHARYNIPMLIPFFLALKNADLPVSIKEYLTLVEALDRNVAARTVDDFYFLSRTCLVKDETLFDRFDRVFGDYFNGVENLMDGLFGEVPEEWLRQLAALNLSEEDRKKIESLGGFEELMETLKQRLAEQQKRHQGGNKWIGTAGTSPFGNSGFNPEGIRIGGSSMNRSAVKVWDKREYQNLDRDVELGTRNLKLALRRLRRFARTGAAEELDLDDTISSTARNAGYLDIKMVPERHNAVKVLAFFDIGGSMDDHIRVCERLFSAAHAEFKHLRYFYFHNCVYERVWQDNYRRHNDAMPTWQVLHKYPSDYKVIFVGDASMSPYEIAQPGGSVEHWNEEAGAVWLERVARTYRRSVWINPVPEQYWNYTHSIAMVRQIFEDRMFPLTMEGLSGAMGALS
jgi:uncharacterized protein with von Willebrand factor type A (vWA) domain